MVPAKKNKKKELTENQAAFLEALPKCNGDLNLAKKMAGYADSTPVRIIVHPIKEEIIETCQAILAVNAPKATFGLIEAMDNPGQVGLQHKMKAITEILDRVGVVKEEKVVNAAEMGLFILPAKNTKITIETVDDEDDMRVVNDKVIDH